MILSDFLRATGAALRKRASMYRAEGRRDFRAMAAAQWRNAMPRDMPSTFDKGTQKVVNKQIRAAEKQLRREFRQNYLKRYDQHLAAVRRGLARK